jgi:hypothetical protein
MKERFHLLYVHIYIVYTLGTQSGDSYGRRTFTLTESCHYQGDKLKVNEKWMCSMYREDGRYMQNCSVARSRRGRTCSDHITVDEVEDCVWYGFNCIRIGAEFLKIL